MARLIPVITEKATKLAKGGMYTFEVNMDVDKHSAKKLVEEVFGVTVKSVRTITKRALTKRTARGRKLYLPKTKKIIVKLGDKDKIDLFEEKKK